MKITAKHLFVFCGAKFYMDWILPTNGASKNPFVRRWWRRGCLYDLRRMDVCERLFWCGAAGFIHLGGCILWVGMPGTLRIWNAAMNVLGNLYPCIVQLYVGYRCLGVKSARYRLKQKSLHRNGGPLK